MITASIMKELNNMYAVQVFSDYAPANIYLFKVNNKNIRKRCEICSKLTIKTPEKGVKSTQF